MSLAFDLRPLQQTPPGVMPAAWFLSGSDPKGWLDELVRCDLANDATRLYLVPRSRTDNGVLGILVLPGAAKRARAVEPHGMRCRRRGAHLYLPMDAEIYPPATDAELSAACGGLVTFFHPATGCAAFEASEALPVCELLELPEERIEDWNAASMGAAGLAAFAGVTMLIELDPVELYGNSAQEIGMKPPAALPQAPGEPSSALPQRLWRLLRAASLQWLSSQMGQLPQTATQRTWMDSVQEWIGRERSSTQGELEWQRNRELKRLMDLLERDPDAGLSFAIPLDAKPGRGKAPSQGRLGRRVTEYSASSTGGGPVDAWTVPEDIHAALRKRYYELANLELSLGRFKRAAYIFATLLGNLHSAANALIQGSHFAEAGRLLERELNDHKRAAECYEKAGLFEDALRLMEQLQLWEDSARIHALMGHIKEAQSAYKHAVEEMERRHDFLGASRILEEHLKDPEGALQSRFRSWPVSPQCWECLELAFGFLGKHGRHAEARDQLHHIASTPTFQQGLREPLNFLVTLAANYPDPEFRRLLRREALHHGSRLLQRQGLDAEDLAPILSTLDVLWPADALFARDGRRFELRARAIKLQEKRRQRPTSSTASKGAGPILKGHFIMPPDTSWHHIHFLGGSFLAIGTQKSGIRCAFRNWIGLDSAFQMEATHEQTELIRRLLVSNWKTAVSLVCPVPSGSAALPSEFHAFCSRHCRLVVLPHDDPPLCLASAATPDHFWMLSSKSQSELELSQFDTNAMLLRVIPIAVPLSPAASVTAQPRVFPTRDGVWVLFNGYVFAYLNDEFQVQQTSREMQCAAASPVGTVPRFAWSNGNRLHIARYETGTTANLELTFTPKRILFLGEDHLLVSSEIEAGLFAVVEEDLVLREQWKWPFTPVEHLVVLEDHTRVGSWDRSGNACLWEFPARLFA